MVLLSSALTGHNAKASLVEVGIFQQAGTPHGIEHAKAGHVCTCITVLYCPQQLLMAWNSLDHSLCGHPARGPALIARMPKESRCEQQMLLIQRMFEHP